MTLPTVAVDTTDLDADTDNPLLARQDLLDLAQKFNLLIAHISTFAGTVLDDANDAAMRATIGAVGLTGNETVAGDKLFSGNTSLGGAIAITGDISPTTLVANTNDYAPTGFSSAGAVRISASSRINLTGLAAGADGRVVTIFNVGTFPVMFTFEDVLSAAGNRFAFGGTLGGGQSAEIQYDATSLRWRSVSWPKAIGEIVDHAGSTLPGDCLAIDQNVLRATYPALFNEIGTAFGVGDGSTTFGLFVGAGRVLIAAGTGTIAEAVAAGSVTTATDIFAVASNNKKWITGQKVQLTTTGGLPAPLALATDYFIVRASATTIKFATSLANAQNGTVIDLTTQGTGTHTLTGTLTARTHGELLGEEDHAQTITELLAHAHSITWSSSLYHGNFNGVNTDTAPSAGVTGTLYGLPSATNSSGGNAAMNVIQPSAVVTRGIRYC